MNLQSRISVMISSGLPAEALARALDTKEVGEMHWTADRARLVGDIETVLSATALSPVALLHRVHPSCPLTLLDLLSEGRSDLVSALLDGATPASVLSVVLPAWRELGDVVVLTARDQTLALRFTALPLAARVH